VNDCDVNLLYLLDSGGPVAKAITAPHASRFTENVNVDIGIQSNSSAYHVVSTSVTVNSTATPNCAGVVTERPMYFTNFMGISSGSDVVGATQFGTTFYFADVPTGGGFASYITILNPSNKSSVAAVTATYYAGGQAIGTPQTVMVQQ
jgi:hypothetical protein